MQVTFNPDAGSVTPFPVVYPPDMDAGMDAAQHVGHTSATLRTTIVMNAIHVGELADAAVTMLHQEEGTDASNLAYVDEYETLRLSLSSKIDTQRLDIKNLAGKHRHEPLTAAGPEMALMALSMEMTQIIDNMLKLRTESQKARNESLIRLNDLSNRLRIFEKSSDEFAAEKLDVEYKKFPADSPMMRKGMERAELERDKITKAAEAAEKRVCDEAVAYGLAKNFTGMVMDPLFTNVYKQLKPQWVTASEEGYLTLWTRTDDGKTHYLNFYLHSRGFYPDNYKRTLISTYNDKTTAIAAAEKKFADYQASGKCSIADALYGFGVYEAGSALPNTKEELEAAHEKISTMTNSIDSEQTLKMTDITKFSQARNESYDMAVKVNTRLTDSLAALIRQLGER